MNCTCVSLVGPPRLALATLDPQVAPDRAYTQARPSRARARDTSEPTPTPAVTARVRGLALRANIELDLLPATTSAQRGALVRSQRESRGRPNYGWYWWRNPSISSIVNAFS